MQILGELPIAYPPIDEQGDILLKSQRQTKKLDCLIQKVKHAIELLQERRTALISAAVTGKIDVRNWQSPEQTRINKEGAS